MTVFRSRRPCFNPRTRVGCDSIRTAEEIKRDLVSIHAPAWGATGTRAARRDAMPVSIHAPAWGATGRHRGIHPDHLRFNPRTRVGCDARRGQARGPPARFNPRTRVGCDVLVSRGDYGIHQRFNPRTRVGCDLVVFVTILLASTVFQSTHPRGVRPFVSVRCRVCYEVSIHAPAWGATGYPALKKVQLLMFQSTHPRGVRPNPNVQKKIRSPVSIHAPAWGATGGFYYWWSGWDVSIHAPAWGATVS